MSDLPLIPKASTTALGEVIGGYRIEREIGAGATSRVFLGRHTRLGRLSAIKVLNSAVVDDARAIKRLLAEAQVVNDIRHPNIVDISDFVETTEPKRIALVMEFVEGPSLKAFRGAPMRFPFALAVALQLVAAVRAAHAAGVVHRDLKADNLLLMDDPRQTNAVPRLKVVDFGIAKVAGPAMGSKPATSIMIGTPAYMAPEQIAGAPPPSAATDVYAIGEVLYEVVTGRRVFDLGGAALTVQAKLHGRIPQLEIPAVPGGDVILELTRSCLALRPHDRPTLDHVQRALLSITPKAVRLRLGPEVVDPEMIETLPPDLGTPSDPMIDTIGDEPRIPPSMTDPTQLVSMAAELAAPAAIAEPVTLDPTRRPDGSVPFVETAASPVGAAADPIAFANTVASPIGESADPIAFADTSVPNVRSPAAVAYAETFASPQVEDVATRSPDTLNPEDLPDTAPGTPAEEHIPTDPGDPWPEEDAKTTPLSSSSLSADVLPLPTPASWTVAPPTPAGRITWPVAAVAAAASALILGVAALVLSERSTAVEPIVDKPTKVETSPTVVAPKAAAILLTSSPDDATVMDAATREVLGVTPLAVMVHGAPRRLVVSRDGHEPKPVDVDGRAPKLHVELARRRATRRVKPKQPTKKGAPAPIAKDDFPTW